MKPIYYSEKIDPVIYGDLTNLFSNGDWIELAIAALDQAGAKIDLQNKVMEIASDAILNSFKSRNFPDTEEGDATQSLQSFLYKVKNAQKELTKE
jgi:hypothetical protein